MNIPVVLPVVAIKVNEDGSLTVQVDGQPYAAQRLFHRSDLRDLLDDITHDIVSPVRVEVAEADGTTYADIAAPSDDSATALVAKESGAPPGMAIQEGRSARFQPGERIAVAYVLMHGTADDSGAATLRLPPAMLSRYQGSLMLLGLESKTMTPLSDSA